MPVRTTAPVPKACLLEVAEAVHAMKLEAPVACGQVVATDLLGTGVDLVACMTLEKKER